MMRSSRISTSNMQLFPGDVITAETLTNGDPKILDRPEFKDDEGAAGKVVYEDLFSSPGQKKLKKKKDVTPMAGFLKMDPRKRNTPARPSKSISLGRLLDLSKDAVAKGYQSKDLLQLEASNGVIEKNFSCVECNYQCSRVNVMLLHYQAHARRFDHKVKYPTGFKRKKRSVNVSSGGVNKKMKLTNGVEEKRVRSKAEVLEMQKKEAEKLKQNFLMDWDEEDNDELEDRSDESGEKSASKEEEKVSCFDFDEEEDEASSSSVSFSNRKRVYSKSEEKEKEKPKEEMTNGNAKFELEDEVDALLNETRMPSLPDIPHSKGGDAITLPPPNESVSDFGTLNSDLNESTDFRTDIVKNTSTPVNAAKLSKQTLKRNYFKKVREEIAETAKFEEEEELEEEENGCDENDAESCKLEEVPKEIRSEIVVETEEPRSVEKETVETPVVGKQIEEPQTSPVKQDVPVKVEAKQSVSTPKQESPLKPVSALEIESLNRQPIQTSMKLTANISTEPSPALGEVQKVERKVEKMETKIEKVETKTEKVETKTEKMETKISDKPNVVQIGNQTIHIPVRRNSKDARKSGEIQKKTEDDRLAEMMFVEEVDVRSRSKFTPVKQHPSSTVHIDMSPREKISFNIGKSDRQRGAVKTMPTIIPIERMQPKFKPINIPSSSTKHVTPVKVSPAKPSGEKFFVLPNNHVIKTPVKSPAKSQVIIASEKQEKPHQSQVVYVPPGSRNIPKSSNVPLITMKSTVKKQTLPIPGLMKISTSKASAKPQSTLQSKIKTIATSNAAKDSVKTSGQGSILVNHSTLPSILQQRRSTQPVRTQPPALVTTPKLIEEPALISEISSIPGVDSSDAVVYLINNEQSQQILCPVSTPAPSSEGQTIFIDPNTTDLSNIFLTIDDDGNILNIVQKTNNVETSAPPSDILAKALADTQVLQAECVVAGPADHYQPIVNNTYETSLTLNQAPIMATSEAPTHVPQTSYYSTATSGIPLLEINPAQDNVVGMASPEIAYTPNDIIRT